MPNRDPRVIEEALAQLGAGGPAPGGPAPGGMPMGGPLMGGPMGPEAPMEAIPVECPNCGHHFEV